MKVLCKKSVVIVVFIISIIFVGCASVPPLTQAEIDEFYVQRAMLLRVEKMYENSLRSIEEQQQMLEAATQQLEAFNRIFEDDTDDQNGGEE